MRIAFLLNEYPTLTETFIRDQAEGLVELGHDVTVFAGRAEPVLAQREDEVAQELARGANYWPRASPDLVARCAQSASAAARLAVRRPGRLWRALSPRRRGPLWKSMRFVLAGEALGEKPRNYDVIHAHFGTLGLVGGFLREEGLLSGRLVTTFYGADLTSALRKWGPGLYAPLLRQSDLLLPICEHFAQVLRGLGADGARMRVHHLGIDPSQFIFRPRQWSVGEPVRLLSVARLVEKKGLDDGLDAVARLTESGLDLRYTIIGDGPLRQRLESRILDLGLAGRVEMPGWLDREAVAAKMRSHHLFLAPSVTARNGDKEGTPTVLLEAMASGLPVVSTHHSGIPEVIEEGKSGYLVPERDPHALAARLAELIEHPGRWGALATRGRERVEAEFDIRRLNRTQESLYRELLAGELST